MGAWKDRESPLGQDGRDRGPVLEGDLVAVALQHQGERGDRRQRGELELSAITW